MSDLISREAAIEAITNYAKFLWNNYYERCNLADLTGMIDVIEALPTAEKVGKWIIHSEVKNIYGGTYIECSECGEKYVVQYIEDEKFCRNCGAKMRGEEDDNK